MKILFIPYGTEKAPATRYRVTQYLSFLKEKDIDYRVFSAISKFSTLLMIKSPDFNPAIRFLYYIYVFIERLIRLLCILFIAKKYDVVFLQRTTFPFGLEKLLKIVNKHIIFDIDDAIYLTDKEGNDILTRIKKYIKKSEVVNILKVTEAVIVENDYIKDFVIGYCKNVFKIPGPIDTERFFAKPKDKQNKVVIGWIGSPATTFYLHMLDSVFKVISEKYDFVEIRFIGLGKYENADIKYERIKWDYATEVRELQRFDIGIMPMPDDKWTRGKLGCKMLQYMAVGMPAVVSYTPTNAEIIKNGENGFFANNIDEWINILSLLVEDGELRRKVGQEGRSTILEKCALTNNINKIVGIFHNATL